MQTSDFQTPNASLEQLDELTKQFVCVVSQLEQRDSSRIVERMLMQVGEALGIDQMSFAALIDRPATNRPGAMGRRSSDAAADTAQCNRLELQAVGAMGADAVRATGCVRRRLHPGGGRSRVWRLEIRD